jgi:hypothetical protein
MTGILQSHQPSLADRLRMDEFAQRRGDDVLAASYFDLKNP